MLQRTRERLGGAGMVISIIALVVALAGTAYAAAKLNGTQKKEVEKIAKKFAGKPGEKGATGLTGPPGPVGPKGAAGVDGKSVTVTSAGLSSACGARGGAIVEEKGTPPGVPVCNGEEGKEGAPWSAGGTLPTEPVEETEEGGEVFINRPIETGVWAFHGGTTEAWVPFSFPIRLPIRLEEEEVHFSSDGNFGDFCGASANFLEVKVAGSMCIYGDGSLTNATLKEVCRPGCNSNGTSPAGGFLVFKLTSTEASGSGAWAVSAPEPEEP